MRVREKDSYVIDQNDGNTLELGKMEVQIGEPKFMNPLRLVQYH